MKILMVHKTYKGGVAVHVKEVSNELRKKGFIVHEVTRNEDLGMKNFITSYQKMKKLFKKWSKEYDIVHTHDWSITYPAIKAGIKNLAATFHALPTNPLAEIFENYCIKKLERNAIVISPIMKRVYPSATYIPNGVNLAFFKKDRKIKRKKGLVGLAQKYNINKILRAVKKVRLKYIITGGVLPFERLPEFYSKIEIFVSIPYKQAGFNMVWLEAMACEVPYIIGTNAGIGEVLPIYKVSNFKELKEILQKIKHNELEPLKNQRRWIIRNKFRWKDSIKKLIKLYNLIICNFYSHHLV